MTLNFTDLLHLLRRPLLPRRFSGGVAPTLELQHLSARDIADLNLPPDVAGRFVGSLQARDLRWKPFA